MKGGSSKPGLENGGAVGFWGPEAYEITFLGARDYADPLRKIYYELANDGSLQQILPLSRAIFDMVQS